MKLTKEQQFEIHDRLKCYFDCPNCHDKKVPYIELEEYHLSSRNRSHDNIHGDILKFVIVAVVSCENCGYVRLFNLSKMGVIDTSYTPPGF